MPSKHKIFGDFNSYVKHDIPKWAAKISNERIVVLDFCWKIADLCHKFGDLYIPQFDEVFTVRPKKDIPENSYFYYFVPKKVNDSFKDDDDAFYVGYRG